MQKRTDTPKRQEVIRGLRYSLVFLLVVFLSACDSQARLNRMPENGVILAFGDSLTAGVGAPDEQSYPAVLAEISGRQVINAGVPGETTKEGLARLSGLLSRHMPDLLILLEGGNDILRNHNLTQTQANLAQMIELIRSKGVDVVLIGVPEKSLFSDSAPFYSELASKYGLVFEEELITSLLRKRKYKSDLVHLNAAGYEKMARSLFELLKNNGAF